MNGSCIVAIIKKDIIMNKEHVAPFKALYLPYYYCVLMTKSEVNKYLYKF